MVITEIFDKLKSLQVILGRKYELEQLIEEAPKQLTSQEELLARMKKEYIEKNNCLCGGRRAYCVHAYVCGLPKRG